MNHISDTAMVLAAGFGKRMRPLTLETPKPLLSVQGRTMLDLALDKLKSFGIPRAIVNAHYMADKIENHLKSRRDLSIIVSREDDILETGGGIKQVIPFFNDKPFFVLAGDLPYTDVDDTQGALSRMAAYWDADKMDALLLVMPCGAARGFDPTKGDFMLGHDGRLKRRGIPNQSHLDHVYISAMLVRPDLYEGISDKAFSNNVIFDLAESRGRLFGLSHVGTCYHIGTPHDLSDANRLLTQGQGWVVAP